MSYSQSRDFKYYVTYFVKWYTLVRLNIQCLTCLLPLGRINNVFVCVLYSYYMHDYYLQHKISFLKRKLWILKKKNFYLTLYFFFKYDLIVFYISVYEACSNLLSFFNSTRCQIPISKVLFLYDEMIIDAVTLIEELHYLNGM